MTFHPPHCPRPECPAHRDPRFRWRRRGKYHRRCDGRDVPRFECLHCGRFFSAQTFRLDYRLRRPELNRLLFPFFVSKVTMRQAARLLGCSRHTVAHRLKLFGHHCRNFHHRRLEESPFPQHGTWLLDELETFEEDRRLQPVTVPVLIERSSTFVLHAETAPMAARGRLSPRDERRKQQREALFGKRHSGSSRAVTNAFTILDRHCDRSEFVHVVTDEKASYAAILKRIFARRVVHEQHSGKARRDARNPLFKINVTLAMLRDGLSRLVRRSWGASKRRGKLDWHLWIWIAWRNYVRYKTNWERRVSPAMVLGIEGRRWTQAELLRERVFAGRAAA